MYELSSGRRLEDAIKNIERPQVPKRKVSIWPLERKGKLVDGLLRTIASEGSTRCPQCKHLWIGRECRCPCAFISNFDYSTFELLILEKYYGTVSYLEER